MSKKNLTVLFLLLSGVIAVLAYAGGKQSNWLSDSQINFAKDNLSTDRGNKLEAQLRDAVINGLTTRAQNHEKRLQAFAQSTGYPNLTPEQTSFSDLLSTKHSNQLTADMRNGLLTRLTYAVTNHEMRLRALEKPTATPTKVDGKCGPTAATCLAGTVKWDNGKTACGTTRTWHCEGSNGWTTANCPFQNPACENYSCQGSYTWTNWHREWKEDNGEHIKCSCTYQLKSQPSHSEELSVPGSYTSEEGEDSCLKFYKGETWTNPFYHGHTYEVTSCYWRFDDPTAKARNSLGKCSRSEDARGHKPTTCIYACEKTDIPSINYYCTKVYKKSCSSLSESACKAQKGCRWEKDLNLVIRWEEDLVIR